MLLNHIHQAGLSIYGGNVQSFNLRRTAKSTPSDIPRPTTDATSGNVAAILKKASAIRQAFVSSDEGGDDDSWSDA
ncbi:hypothetical protein B296_00035202 [Ensete ventricosum]|uniref:WH2 domain-containing protein n=1 Tax=Ensete ventricosum TaxID=4639 RepID=A0A426ZH09_ENSVE|nr:hypothetical protein B296_00035202 [Ensete ventricosum]